MYALCTHITNAKEYNIKTPVETCRKPLSSLHNILTRLNALNLINNHFTNRVQFLKGYA